MTNPAEIAATGLVGLAVGSFLTVVAHRVPEGESIVAPSSRCPSCGEAIRHVDNVPVLSYLLLRGHCRTCGTAIPIRYPLIEVGTASLFCAVAARVPEVWALAAYCVLAAALVVLSVIDLERFRLPSPVIYVAAGLGAALLVGASAGSGDWNACEHALVAAAVCGGVFLLIRLAVPRAMGLGDVRLAALCGGFLGWLGYGVTAVGFMLSFVLGGLLAVGLLVAGRVQRGGRLPFGPFLATGAMVAVLWGSDLARIWLR